MYCHNPKNHTTAHLHATELVYCRFVFLFNPLPMRLLNNYFNINNNISLKTY